MGLMSFGDFNNKVTEDSADNAWKKFDTDLEIVGTEWRAAGQFGTVGFVAVKDHKIDAWGCYLGLSDGKDEKNDAINIAKWGSLQPEDEALAYFPNMKEQKYKK